MGTHDHGQCEVDPERICPWTDEQRLEDVENKIAEKAGRNWWKGFPWRLVTGLLSVTSLLAVYIWTGVATRVERVESTVANHMLANATTEEQYRNLSKQVGEMQADVQSLHAALNTRSELDEANNKMLKRLVARLARE